MVKRSCSDNGTGRFRQWILSVNFGGPVRGLLIFGIYRPNGIFFGSPEWDMTELSLFVPGLCTRIPHLTAEIAWLRPPLTSIIIAMFRPRFCYDCSYYWDHCDNSCNLRYLLLRTSAYSIATRIPPNRPRRSVLRCICCSFAFWFCSLQCGIVV